MTVFDHTLPSPAENLAADEALLEAAEAGIGGEVLRFWESPVPFVVVGYANQVVNEVNVAACQARGIPILRRCTGGGTVVQGPGSLNYGLILRIATNSPTRNITAANQFIMERNRAAVEAAVGDPSVNIHIQGHTDLTLGRRKFSGNAQRRRRQFLLFHGTLLLDFDIGLIIELLRLPSLQPGYREQRSHADFLTVLAVTRNQIKSALIRAWEAEIEPMTTPQLLIPPALLGKYSSPDWNYRW